MTDHADTLDMFIIYRNPSDYPGKFIVRQWIVGGGPLRAAKEPLAIADTLQLARICLHTARPGLTLLGRFDDDDPAIEEVWV